MTTEKKDPIRRVYRVDTAGSKPRLVNATSSAVAVLHVFKTQVRVASQQDFMALIPDGVKVEEA